MSVFDDPGHFGKLWASTYDNPSLPDPSQAVQFLAEVAGAGPVLELAIGTGRVALPLAARGIAVEGIEGAPEMVAVLRGKPGGDTIPVTVGDMADVPVEGPYSLVFLVFNTLFNLDKADRQADCFHNIARVLRPGGAFVVEAFVPDPAAFDRDEQVQMRSVTEDSASIRLHQYDRAAQRFVRQTITFDAGGVHLAPFAMRYLWPEQIDELAAAAGLHLEARYADWTRSPYTTDSRNHISVYRTRE
ncbi:class I SAM-dependent methyltransferase [Dactylosporangium sp. NPDC049525]|uniref:class I SAM-dependent methyltransferase n=1 Tax=Dactylosporangium sp. NPDC049525 TaxID=3154730 RepID=UPI00343F649A